MTNVKLSQIAGGGNIASNTDTIVAVRSGTTDVLVSVGTSAVENLGNNIVDDGAGNLVIQTASVSNSMLVHSSLTVSGVSGVTGGGSVALGSAITLGMADSIANTLAGYNNSGVFTDVAIGTNLSLSGNTLGCTAISAVSSVFSRTGIVTANWNDYQFNLIGGVASVSQGGTGVQTLTAHSVLLGEGTANVSAATTGIAARLLIDQGVADPAFKIVTGDVSINSAGAVSVLQVNSVAYPAAPATNTVPVVTGSNTVTYEAVPNAALAYSAITIGAQTGLAGGGSVALGSAITLSMGTGTANTLGGYNSSGVFSDVSIGTNLNLVAGVLSGSAVSAGQNITISYSGSNVLGITAASSAGGPPTGTAGGSLTGTYPNPTIANAAVSNTMLQNSAITIGAQTGLAGGGSVALGAAITLSMGIGSANTLAGYNNSGVFSDVAIGSNLTLVGGTLNATGGGGGAVSSVFGRTGAVVANWNDYQFNLIGGVASVSQGGTGVQTLSTHGVLLGEGTANVSAATTGIVARILIDQGAADPSFQVLSGDSSLASTGNMVNLAVHGVTYPANPSTNTVPVVTSSNVVTYETVPNAALANSAITIGAQTGLAGGGSVALGSAITLSMGTSVANTLAGYNNSGVFSDVTIGTNLTLSGGVLNAAAASGGGSGLTTSINSVSTNTNAGSSSRTWYIYLCTGTMTLTLPTAIGNTNPYTVKNVGTNTVTIGSTSGTIDGASTLSNITNYQSNDFISDNTNWNIV